METMETHIRSGVAAIFVHTQEEDRAVHSTKHIARTKLKSSNLPSGYHCLTWTVSNGINYEIQDGLGTTDRARAELKKEETKDPAVALTVFLKEADKVPRYTILLMLDLHLHLKGNNPTLIRLLKEAIRYGRKTNRHIVMIGAEPIKCRELEKEIQVIDLPLPDKNVLTTVVEDMARAASISMDQNGDTAAIVTAMAGLTAEESANALAYSLAKKKKFDVELISSIKTESIRRNGIVEIVDANVSMDDIGGLKRFKQHLRFIAKSWTKEARAFGVPQPQSLLAVGQAGTAKSLSCMALKTIMGLPLLRLEAGRLFGSFVGESEGNWRAAFATAKALGQCILWVDEAEALFAGASASGRCDSGTTGRVVKAILQDMQMNSEGVFFAFTSNDIDGFPDPLIDRCDVWAFDLPDTEERKQIWEIHIRKKRTEETKIIRDPKKYSVDLFTEASDGFSGRQIEQAWVKSILASFNDGGREPGDTDVLSVLKEFIPTSVTMKDAIERRRARLHNRAQNASR